MPRLIQKVLIYATSARGLLVFSEPDFPEIGLQVPGGTMEAGELPSYSAKREFEEETGLSAEVFRFLGQTEHLKTYQGEERFYRRFYFQTHLSGDLSETWDHIERFPSDGAPPILFRFAWMSPETAQGRLGYDHGELLHRLK